MGYKTITTNEYVDGNLISSIVNDDGKIRRTVRFYNDKKQEIRREYYKQEEITSYSELEYENGLLICASHYKASGKKESMGEYIYNNKNQLIRRISWSPNGEKKLGYSIFKYNAKGEMILSIDYDALGCETDRWKYKYDLCGREIVTVQIGCDASEYTTETQYSKDCCHSYITVYDKQGKIVMEGEGFYDEDGKLLKEINEWSW